MLSAKDMFTVPDLRIQAKTFKEDSSNSQLLVVTIFGRTRVFLSSRVTFTLRIRKDITRGKAITPCSSCEIVILATN
jgi:hypothetical protein